MCHGPGLTACTECGPHPTNSSVFYKRIGYDICTEDCPTGEYELDLGYTCAVCHEACSSCNMTATDCQSCQNVTGNVFYNLNNVCYQTCPDGYYGEESTNLCR